MGNYPELTMRQWKFLTVLDALGGSLSIDTLDVLAPLTPGQLFDLLKKTSSSGLLLQEDSGQFSLGSPLPDDLAKRIRQVNTPKILSSLADEIYFQKIDKVLEPGVLISLFERSGRAVEAGRLEFDTADRELSNGNFETARKYLMSAVIRLRRLNLDPDTGSLFISHALKLSNLCFSLGRDINELSWILLKAQDMATLMGDKRSQALINLHTGRLYYFIGRRDEALVALSVGLEEVTDLGDDDIIAQSAEFLGLFYSMKGQFREAMKYLERVENLINISEETTSPLTYILFSYSSIYLGQFHRVIGFLDSSLRLAEERPNKALSSVLRSILGTTLVMVRKYREAEQHLKLARKEALDDENAFGYHFSGGGLALLSFMKGRHEESHGILKDTVERAIKVGLIQQYSSPWILELSYEFHKLGYEPITGFEYRTILNAALKGVNVHLQGVALRLRAQERMDQGRRDRRSIIADLEASRKCLDLSGNRIQAAKTVLEMARLNLLENDRDKACDHVQVAWRLYGGYAQDLFPDQYKTLLNKKQREPYAHLAKDDYLERYFEELETIKNSMDQGEILSKTIISTNRLFGAERGGLFWFPEGKFTKNPELRAVSNLTREEVDSPEFRPYLEHVLTAFRMNKPLVVRNKTGERSTQEKKIRSVMCIPINVQGKTRGVLYHDNSYLQDAFDYLDPGTMAMLGQHTSDMVDFLLSNMRMKEEKEKLSREKITSRQEFKGCRIIARSQTMDKQLAMADQAADTDTTVLILGETGTGKGLIARWVHEKSPRADGPFIVVDCTTIPENLFESELFGYEKGAFTGADRQKLGRIELAHEGTLFLDEIGELPLNVQTKLLKAIEEKTFVRIGGGRPIRSDFRLIVATNRNLKAEVAAGRFREDLYYRLNVFPISIPPLRERERDIVELARHFVGVYAREYSRPDLAISKQDEKILMKYAWPGNVRELQNVIERAVILSKGDEFHISLSPSDPTQDSGNPFDEMPTLDELQRKYIQYVIAHTRGRISGPGGATEILGMKRTSLYSRMRALGMKK